MSAADGIENQGEGSFAYVKCKVLEQFGRFP
jgi:hypothetical protein